MKHGNGQLIDDFPIQTSISSGVSSIFPMIFPWKPPFPTGISKPWLMTPIVYESPWVPGLKPKPALRPGHGIFPSWRLSHPSEQYDFVSWHDDIPHIWKIKFMFQTTKQFHMNGGRVSPSSMMFYENSPMTWIQNETDFSDAMDFLTDIQKWRRRLAYD